MFDGTFVDNFTIGPPVLKALRARFPEAFFDCHLALKVSLAQRCQANGTSRLLKLLSELLKRAPLKVTCFFDLLWHRTPCTMLSMWPQQVHLW